MEKSQEKAHVLYERKSENWFLMALKDGGDTQNFKHTEQCLWNSHGKDT